MKLKFLLCIALTFAVFSAQAQQIKRIDGTSISTDSLAARITYLMKAANVCGLGISVFNDNQPVYVRTFGLADVQNSIPFTTGQVLYGASFSKAVFAYIVAQLVQEKVIDLDKPLVNYLPKPLPDYKIPGFHRGYQDIAGDKRYEKITARMCMDHTTGLPNWRWFEPGMKLKFKFSPGERYSYSGEGMYLLQFVIEQVTGRDYETLAQARVFKPLGMTHTSYVWQDDFAGNLVLGHDAAGKAYKLMHWKEAGCAGTMSTTVADYTKFFTALLNHKGLSKKIFNQLIRPQVRICSVKQFGPMAVNDSTLNDKIQLGYGLGLGVFKTPYGRAFFKEGHDDGWGHYSVAFPDKKIAVVIMTNNDNGESIFRDLLKTSIGDVYSPWEWEDYIPYFAKGR